LGKYEIGGTVPIYVLKGGGKREGLTLILPWGWHIIVMRKQTKIKIWRKIIMAKIIKIMVISEEVKI